MDQIIFAVDWGFLAIRKTMRKNGIGHYMRRTEVRKERQRSLTEAELRGQTVLYYIRAGSAVVRGGG